MSHGGKRKGAGRKPIEPEKRKKSRTITLSRKAWERIDCRAAAMGRSRNETIQRWAERLPIL